MTPDQHEFGWQDEPFRLVTEHTTDNAQAEAEQFQRELDKAEAAKHQLRLDTEHQIRQSKAANREKKETT